MPVSQSRLIVAVSLLALVAAAALGPTLWRGETDFLSFYAGARLAGTPHLYSWEHAHAIQKGHVRNPNELRAYIRPPWYALMLKPLGAFPYGTALWLWQSLNVAALAVLVAAGKPKAVRAALCGWYFPAWINLAQSQDMPLLLLSVCTSCALLARKRDLEAGLAFSLCSTKAHLFLPLPVYILAARKWAFGVGLLAGGVVLTAASFLAAGPAWLLEYHRLLVANEQNQASQAYMPTLLGLFHRFPASFIWILAGIAALLWLTWRGVRRVEPAAGLELTVASGLLTSPHAFIYDFMLLLPLLLRLAERDRLEKQGPVLFLVAAAALLNTEPAISWAGPLLAVVIFIVLWRRVTHGLTADRKRASAPPSAV